VFENEDIDELKNFSDKIIFNSISRLNTFYDKVSHLDVGLRVNPSVSYSEYDLADPGRKFSRLGVKEKALSQDVFDKINGVMFHYNCENDNFKNYTLLLDYISKTYKDILLKLKWVNLGGGVLFTQKDYPIEEFSEKLKRFSDNYNIQVYMEPGEAIVQNSGYLYTNIIDIIHNEIDIAIVNSSIEGHMLDLLTYRCDAESEDNESGDYTYMITGNSCLAGDVFGTYNYGSKLKIGDTIKFTNTAGYTMVKKNWFNGLKMPSIVIKRLNGKYELIKSFNYNDFKYSLS
jgi:carboxynorspermidine decarboxylase